jgi:hypothetical protein
MLRPHVDLRPKLDFVPGTTACATTAQGCNDDVLDTFAVIRICTAYFVDGGARVYLRYGLTLLARAYLSPASLSAPCANRSSPSDPLLVARS